MGNLLYIEFQKLNLFKESENIENGKSYTYKAFDSSNVYRRLKGGSWYEDANVCTVLSRSHDQATYDFNSVGFRLVRTI